MPNIPHSGTIKTIIVQPIISDQVVVRDAKAIRFLEEISMKLTKLIDAMREGK